MLNHASTAAAHTLRREWVPLQPGKCVKRVSAHRGLCSMLLPSRTGSSRVLGRDGATAAAGLGSPSHQACRWRPFGGTAHKAGTGLAGYRATPMSSTSEVTWASLKPRVAQRFAEPELKWAVRAVALAPCGSCGTGQHRAAPGSVCLHSASAVPSMCLPGSWATRILTSLAFPSLLTTKQPRVF